MPILRTILCTACGNMEKEKQKTNGNEHPGWEHWGGLNGILKNGQQVTLCPDCLNTIVGVVDSMRVENGLD